MGLWCGVFYKHWILFSSMWHLPRLSKERTQWNKICKKRPFSELGVELLGTVEDRGVFFTYMLRCVLQASNPFLIHVTFTEIVPGAYPVETKNVLKAAIFVPVRLSHVGIVSKPLNVRSRHFHRIVQRPYCGFTYIHRFFLVEYLDFRLTAEADARSVGDSHLSCQHCPKTLYFLLFFILFYFYFILILF